MKSEWTDKMRDALGEYSEAEPEGLWEGISEGLAGRQAVRNRRMLWSVTGAAAAAVAVFFLLLDVSEDRAAISPEAGAAESLVVEEPAVAVSVPEEEPVSILLSDAVVNNQKKPIRRDATSEPLPDAGNHPEEITASSEEEMTVSDDIPVESGPTSGKVTDKGIGESDESDKGAVTMGWTVADEEPQRRNRGRISLSLSGANMFRNSASGSSSESVLSGYTDTEVTVSDNAAFSSLSRKNHEMRADDTKVYVRSDDVTYSRDAINTTTPAVVSSEHRQPVRVGVNAVWQFHRRIRLESGLTYAWLKSDFKLSDGSAVRQTLHYLGLPLGVNFTLWGNDRWDVYLSAGGLMEKCIAGKRTTDGSLRSGGTRSSESVMDGPLQWSLNGGAGVQVSLGKVFGFYVEPGVAYYFDNGSSVMSFYKENLWSLNLRFGFRFTFR